MQTTYLVAGGMMMQHVGETLKNDVLARRVQLPLKPAAITLAGQFVRLEPLDIAQDVAALYAMSDGRAVTLGERHHPAYDADALIWRYMSGGPFASADALAQWLAHQADADNGQPFCVRQVSTGQAVGVVNLMSNVPAHLKIELGNIWYSPVVQRTATNTEAVYLLLRHCFDLGYRRVEWKCDSLNERSRKAALRLGFQFEGIQQAHYIVKNRNRDTAWFRLLDHEWPAVQAQLEARLYGVSGIDL